MHGQKLQKTIGHEFKNPDLFIEALTHPSLAHEKGGPGNHHNQRLEFLGDAVLQLMLTDHIFKLYPDLPEGKLTQIRAHLANRHALYRRAQAIELGEYLLLGKGEEASGGRERLSNLADAYEALLGAIYLDGGVRAARKFISTQFAGEFKQIKQSTPRQNPKGLLQELLQARSAANPVYRVVEESGPDHNKYFEAVVEWEGCAIGRGHGCSKKQAEAAAAEDALHALGQEPLKTSIAAPGISPLSTQVNSLWEQKRTAHQRQAET
ncbi:MAG: ribonuclease III [Verrucomicrobiia bacterium]|jgi:ribonuclease-3